MASVTTMSSIRMLQQQLLWQIYRNSKTELAYAYYQLDVMKRHATGKMKVEAMPSKGGEKMVRVKL